MNKEGTISAVRIISAILVSKDAAQCIRTAVAKWQFATEGSAGGTIRFTLVF
jgi:hypothetical protein